MTNLRFRRPAVILLVVAFLGPVPSPVRAQGRPGAQEVIVLEEAVTQCRSVTRELMADQKIPGLSISVWIDGRFVWSEGFGYSDMETRVPVWPHTRFRIGSISKPLTAAALAKLYEAGRLDMDSPVWHYVPSFPDKEHPITTRQLAGHLAGIRHYRGTEFLISRRYDSVLDALTIFRHDPLVHHPGEKFTYSSYGFNLLSAVIEGASGQGFLSYMDEHVFDPVGMRHTVADRPARIIAKRTRFYARGPKGRLINAPYVNNSYKWAGGGFLSTPEDLCRFAAAHLRDDFLKQETIERLWTSQHTNDGKETGYGIGWRVTTDEAGRRRVGHGGGSVGGSSQLVVYPEAKLILAVTANMSGVRYGDAHYHIAELFLGDGEKAKTEKEAGGR